MNDFLKPVFSFAESFIRPTLDVLIYIKTQMERHDNTWFCGYVVPFVYAIHRLVHGRIEEPCWEKSMVYNVNRDKNRPVFVQKNSVGFRVWTVPSFLNQSQNSTCEIMKPCFISIRYISELGVQLDLDLEPEFYVSGNELLSSGFVEWWIKTRIGVYWSNYSPEDSYTIYLMDNQLNVLELGPQDMVVVNKKGFPSGLPYKKFQYMGEPTVPPIPPPFGRPG